MSKLNTILLGLIFILAVPFSLSQDRWAAPESAKATINPVQGKKIKKSAKKGAKLFASRCVVCHGSKGLGDGPGGKMLNPKPADFSSARVQDQTDGEIFWKMSEGRGPMITWKHILSEDERWHLVNFLRTLKK